MRRSWRWKLCAAGWVTVTYICILALIAVVNLTDPSIQKAYRVLNDATNAQSGGADAWSSRRSGRGARLPWCQPLRWRVPSGPSTALVSFPGSGNTWLRYLLQQATGLYTGSVYKDFALLKNGFPAESVSNGSVIVVKTHEYGPEIREKFARGILMLREPDQAIQAEFNRQSGGHIGHAQPTKYTKDRGKYWRQFVVQKAAAWMNTTLDWLRFGGPMHLLFYEDLLDNLPEEMRRVLEFLDMEVEDSAFDCMMRHKDGIYKRRRRSLGFEPFSPDLRRLLERCKAIADAAIREFLSGSNMDDFIGSLNVSLSAWRDEGKSIR